MTINEAIQKFIDVANAEVGYCEKASNSNLDSKTANAGSANYTKYWRDIKPSYQGQPWCACFVTWCLVQIWGIDKATKLLKHYPFVYCPTMGSLHKCNSNPKKGDVVLFYRKGTFAHTGIVTGVNGDYFTTVEGNTSGGSTIVPNGGGVHKKGYYNSNLPGTKFVTLDWSLVCEPEMPAAPVHWCKEFVDKTAAYLKANGGELDKDFWSDYEQPVKKCHALALLDKITGGTWKSGESNTAIHWCHPHIISLCGKGIINEPKQWIESAEDTISKALVLALLDKATGGMAKKYVDRNADHWGRNHLDSLCDKVIVTTPEAWSDFDSNCSRGNYIALMCKSLIK